MSEQAFLRSRQARKQQQQQLVNTDDNDGNDNVVVVAAVGQTLRDRQRQQTAQMTQFWNILRQKLKGWESRLDDVVQQVFAAVEQQAQQPHAQRAQQPQLDVLKNELYAIRRQALAIGSGETTWDHIDDDVVKDDDDDDGGLTFQLSSATDWRLLHDEFSRYATKWDQAQRQIVQCNGVSTSSTTCSTFRFHRYRAELARRQAMEAFGENMMDPNLDGKQPTKTTTATTTTPLFPAALSPESCLQDLQNFNITVGVHGHVTIENQQESKRSHPSSEDTPPLHPKNETMPTGTPLHLFHLMGCRVTLYVDPLQGLYLIGLKDTTVVVASDVTSAVHVTDCHASSLVMERRAQQLRIHGSHQLKVCLSEQWTPGAIIMEDSHDVEFEVSTTNAHAHTEGVLLDVKDFNWLRSGAPSPNFVVKAVPHLIVVHETNQGNSQEIPTMPSLVHKALPTTVLTEFTAGMAQQQDEAESVEVDNDDHAAADDDEL